MSNGSYQMDCVEADKLEEEVRKNLSSAGRGINGELVRRVSRATVGILEQSLGVRFDEIKPYATLEKDLGAQSIDYLDIVMRAEEELGIDMPRKGEEHYSEKRVLDLTLDFYNTVQEQRK